jgi:cytochrome b561
MSRMTLAESERLLFAMRGASRKPPRGTAFHWSLALLVVLAGVLGLYFRSIPGQGLASWLNANVLFGLLLWSLVITRFHRRMQQLTPALPTDIRHLCRELSLMVYLLLYAIVLIRQIVCLLKIIPDGGTQDLQAILAYGLVALVVIRVLAFKAWRRAHSPQSIKSECP